MTECLSNHRFLFLSGGACLYVHGSGACPVVEDCQVCDSESVGIYVDDGATGLYFNNDIFNNKLAGVWIRNLAAPIFRRNKVHHGRDVGFFVFDRGQGLLEANTVSENRIAGVEVKNEANPIVLKNNICNGKTGGVYIHDSVSGPLTVQWCSEVGIILDRKPAPWHCAVWLCVYPIGLHTWGVALATLSNGVELFPAVHRVPSDTHSKLAILNTVADLIVSL